MGVCGDCIIVPNVVYSKNREVRVKMMGDTHVKRTPVL